MKFIVNLTFLLLFFCFSCNTSHEKTDGLELEITSKEIVSKEKFENNVNRFYQTAILDIADSLPLNKIDLKITNTGNKTYVLYLNKNFDGVEFPANRENIKTVVYQNNQILLPAYFGAAVSWTVDAYIIRKWKNEIYADSLKYEFNEKYLHRKINFNKIEFEREFNYIVIHPKESKFFTFYRTFPYFLEDNFESRYKYSFKANEKYYFQVSIKNDAQKLTKNLNENQQKEIKENGYSIFNGVIKSNKIPITFIK